MHILWVHNSTSILLSQTFKFLNTSPNYKDATGNIAVKAYWPWSPNYFLWLWRVWVVCIYIYISYNHMSYIVCCLFVSLVYHQKHIALRGTTASQSLPTRRQTCRPNVSPEDMDGLLMWQCAFWLFLVFQNCLLTHTHLQEIRLSKHQSLCSKSSL